GVVLYEMVTGEQLFQAETISDMLAAVLTQQVAWDRLDTRVRSLLRRCLTRDPHGRMRDIGEARIAIDEILKAPSTPIPAATTKRSLVPLWSFLALALLMTGVGLWGWMRPIPHLRQPVTRFTTSLPDGSGPAEGGIAISPDGSRIAFAAGSKRQIYIRMIDQFDAKPIPDTEGATFLSFSPDGQWISFIDGSRPTQLRKVS